MSESNQDGQGAAPAPKQAAPVDAPNTPNPASKEAAAALAQGDVVPNQQSPSPVVENTPKPVVVGDPNDEKVDGPTGTADDAGVVVYDTTGDPGMDMALSFVGKLGLLPTHPAMIKASEGDFSFIKAHLASLGDKALGWEQHIALAEQAYGNNVAKLEKLNKEIATSVYAAAGGEEAWKTIEKWAKANASEEERKVINAMLADNPVTARAAVLMLRQTFEGASGTTVKGANPITGATPGAGSTDNGVSPLSPKEYGAAVIELNRRKPGAVDRGDPEYRQLQQRALAYKRAN